MRVTVCKNPNCEKCEHYTIHRDHWTEWLWFTVSYESRMKGVPIPKGYATRKVSVFPSSFGNVYSDNWTYYFIPLIPFICVYDWLVLKWYKSAFWFRVHGMLDKKEGEPYHKFWPAYLHWPRKK